MRNRLTESKDSLRAVWRNAPLRRVEIARAIVAVGAFGSTVFFVVVVFRAGGSSAVAAMVIARALGIAVAAPFGAVLGDRFARHLVMGVTDLVRAAVLVGAALAVNAGAPVVPVIVFSALTAVVGTASAPARAALVPALARTPEELTAANAVASTSENLATFVGPAVAGALLSFLDPAIGLGATAGSSLLSALLVLTIGEKGRISSTGRRYSLISREAFAGFRSVLADRPTALVVAIFSAQTLVGGAIGVLVPSAAAHLLSMGSAGAGYLYSALGIGGVVGAALAVVIGDRRLGLGLALATLAWSASLALVGAWAVAAAALVLFAASGAADGVVDVFGTIVLQRRIPDEVYARAMGAMATIMLGFTTLGNLLAPLALSALGIRTTLIVFGALIPATAVAWWRPVSRLDAAAPPALAALRNVPLFAGLPINVLERLAQDAERVTFRPGEQVFRQGEPGDLFYVVLYGEAEIAVDGRVVARAVEGDHFGEIALLRDQPRTATVIAVDELAAYAVVRERFLEAVTADPASAAAADELVVSRMRRALPVAAEPV